LAAFILTDEQKVEAFLRPKTAAGNPAKVDGVPVWSSTDTAILTVAAATDGLSAIVTTVGQLGTAQVNVTADADLGDGVRSIAATQDFEVKAAEAVSVGIEVGAAEVK
jgi:hypothetical protein